MKAYKGFNRDMTCKGFQYEEGKTYDMDEIKICEKGFHACKYPLDVFTYYKPDTSVYHEVELGGEILTETAPGDSKVCASKIRIGKRISVNELIEAAAELNEYRSDHNRMPSNMYGYESTDSKNGIATTTGPMSVAYADGWYALAGSTGLQTTAISDGHNSISVTTDNESLATNKRGSHSLAASTGENSMVSTGNQSYRSIAAGTGNSSIESTNEMCTIAANTGNYSYTSSEREYSMAVSTGENSVVESEGGANVAENSGDNSIARAKGNRSAAVVTGNGSYAYADSPGTIAVAWGVNGSAAGVKGSYLMLSEWDFKNDRSVRRLLHTKLIHVDGKKYKENTPYMLSLGEVVVAP